jgi:hypothetical protein
MYSCVLKTRKGVVMVSPFIFMQEKQVMEFLLREQRPFILLVDNGFRDYNKPSDALFDACAAGRLLILSPWPCIKQRRWILKQRRWMIKLRRCFNFSLGKRLVCLIAQ